MGATPEFSLPWPELPDRPQGPDGFKNLATAIEAATLLQRDDGSLTKSYTPTWLSKLTQQPTGAVWTARYEVRNGWCEVDIFGQFSASTYGGRGPLVVGLPVKARSGITQQYLSVKYGTSTVGSYLGYAYMLATGAECIPYLPINQFSTKMNLWQSANESGAAGTGCPAVPGQYTVAPGNISIWGRYLV